MSLTIGARIGPYEVLAPIGAGGMGQVYRGRDTTLQRDVALKVLPDLFAHDPERLARFQREAQVLASLNHPHIAQVYGFENAGEVRVLAMEFVPGETLEERLKTHGSGLTAQDVLQIAQQLAEALEAAHEQGIVHRDLKPANVKVTPDGNVKVLDFGLAKLAQTSGSGLQTPGIQAAGLTQSPTMTSPVMVTSAGMLLGTAAYMAPEQARGKAVDKRADIWAVGCVLFELLSGKPAFEGETVTDVLSAIVSKEPDWSLLPGSTPPHLRALIERCLAKEPRARLRDIGEARIAVGLPSTTQAPTLAASKGAFSWRERAAWAMAVIGVLAVVAAFTRVPRPSSTPRPAAIQLSVDLPAGVQLSASGDPRLSPDGTQLVFRANDGRGVAFWMRDLRMGGPSRRLSDTVDPLRSAAWAPDGSAFAFFAGPRVLRALDLASGAVRTISAVPENIGNPSAAWGAHGDIIFGGALGNLYRVAATGGTPTALTVLQEGQVGHYHPSFLPDGRRFVYSVNRRAGTATSDDEVWLSSIEEPQVGRLLLSGARGMFVAPDVLLALKEGTLFVHRLDLGTGAVSPESAVVPVTLGAFDGGYSYSALGHVLAFRPAGSDLKRRLAWYDRTGRSEGEIDVPDNAQGVEIAPDASRAVFEVFEPGLSFRDLWVAGFATGASQKFVFTNADESDAKWMPDSKTIVFAARSEDAGPIMQVLLDSTEPPTVLSALKHAESQYPASLSRDGRVLAFMQGNVPFWWILSESQPKRLPQTVGLATSRPRGSPDGRWLLYESTEAGRRQVFLEPLPPTGARWPISRDGGTWARWHPNGREIYFVAPDDAMMAVAIRTTPGLELSLPTRLFQTRIAQPTRSGVHANYDVAPDGRFLIVENTAPAEQDSSLRIIVNWQSLLPQPR